MPLRPIRLVAPLLLVAGCVAAPEPPPAPPPAVAPTRAPPPVPIAADWQDWPPTPGAWRYARGADGSQAVFGAAGATVRIACVAATRQVTLGPASAGPLTVRTSSTTRAVTVDAGGAVRLAASDPLLDAIAFSRGRFTVEQPQRPPLVLPPHAEIGRVIEDCRG